MYISFNTKDIRKVCEDDSVAQETLGIPVATRLHGRLSDLNVAKSVFELPVGKPEEFEKGKYKIDLCDGYILIFGPANTKVPVLENGLVDWSKVDRIKILDITVYE